VHGVSAKDDLAQARAGHVRQGRRGEFPPESAGLAWVLENLVEGRVVNRKRTVRTRLRGGLGRGTYKATVSALHTDGHVMTKSWTFKLK
jgi:hypothetical protein